MLNCLFFRIFSSVSFVSLYQTKAQRSGFCLELRSKGAERVMLSPARRYTRSGLCDEVVGMGFCPIFGIWQDAGTPATSQMRCWLLRRHKLHIPRPAASGRSRPFRCASSQNRNRVAGLRFCIFCARRRNVGFSCCAAHTPRSLLGKPHTAATRASRHGAGARHTRRVDRADCFHGQKIGTIGTFKGNPPFAVAAVGIRQNPFFS